MYNLIVCVLHIRIFSVFLKIKMILKMIILLLSHNYTTVYVFLIFSFTVE